MSACAPPATSEARNPSPRRRHPDPQQQQATEGRKKRLKKLEEIQKMKKNYTNQLTPLKKL